MRVLVVGCGYIGLSLGKALRAAGHEVWAVRRNASASEELNAANLHPLIADITQPETLSQHPPEFDWVINLVSSGRGGPEEYRKVFLNGTQNLMAWLQGSPVKKFIFTSSTSVYGQQDGSMVKESSPTLPARETSRILLEGEEEILRGNREKNFPALILRVAGIYGPDRNYLLQQYLKNEAKIYGQGQRLLNMIHRDDVVGAMIATLKSGRTGEVYNLVDDEPVTEIHFFRWLSETLGKNMPPFIPKEQMEERKRGATNKKVQNRRLKMELGYQFKYPTFRQGYTAEIKRLDEAGLLDFDPEPR